MDGRRGAGEGSRPASDFLRVTAWWPPAYRQRTNEEGVADVVLLGSEVFSILFSASFKYEKITKYVRIIS